MSFKNFLWREHLALEKEKESTNTTSKGSSSVQSTGSCKGAVLRASGKGIVPNAANDNLLKGGGTTKGGGFNEEEKDPLSYVSVCSPEAQLCQSGLSFSGEVVDAISHYACPQTITTFLLWLGSLICIRRTLKHNGQEMHAAIHYVSPCGDRETRVMLQVFYTLCAILSINAYITFFII